ncbi:amidohydrolase family protein, partial [Streptomonospora wellingtoniae]
MKQIDLLIHNIGCLITMQGSLKPRAGKEQSEVLTIHHGAIAIQGEKIVAIGSEKEVRKSIHGLSIIKELDAQGRLVTPGLIDPHTHLVHGGSREHELDLKLKGVSYLEILAQGGGILNTVQATRNATEEELY